MDINYQRLLSSIGHNFLDARLVELALTHRSHSAKNNERLEFLGDAVLGLVISDILYGRFNNAREGELSQLRASLVKGTTLAEVARELGIAEQLRLGSGEMKSGGARRDTILADAMEAVIGAIFLDSGIDACRDRIEHWFGGRLDSLSVDTINKDPKTSLQEYLQGLGRALPKYQVVETVGDAHAQLFTVECILSDTKQRGIGQGSSRKKAEQLAAINILDQIIKVDERKSSGVARRPTILNDD